MTAQSTVEAGRRAAEALMRSQVSVTRVDPAAPPDPLTGEAARVEVYAGPAKLQNQNQYESTPNAGGHTFVIQRSLVHFPVGSFQMANGDLCEFLSSPAPYVAGQKYRLTGEAPYRDFETSYRVFADQVVS